VILTPRGSAYLVALPVLYLALAAFDLKTLYAPVSLMRVAVGVTTSLSLAVTAWQRQRKQRREELADVAYEHEGVLFRLLVLILAGSLTYGLWQGEYFPVPEHLTLTFYALVVVGALLILSSADLMRKGLGLIILLGGFESLYLALEPGLLVITLISVVDILLVVAIAYLAAVWTKDEPQEESEL